MTTPRRTVLITGGSRGLGLHLAHRLAAEGWSVALVARTLSHLEAAAEALRNSGADALALSADVLDPPALSRAVERIAAWSEGRIDALIHSAGRLQAIGPTLAVDPQSAWTDLETSLRGFWNASRAIYPWLKDSPLASITVLVGPGHNSDLAFGALYAAAQAALVRLVESLSVELRNPSIPVYALNPGLVPTGLVQHLLDTPEGRRWLPRFTESFAEGKEVPPDVAADMAAWLLSRRPPELSGRVVPAPLAPDLLETRLPTIAAHDRLRLRLT